MGNEISGRQKEVSNKYGISLDELRRWYHNHYIEFLIREIAQEAWNNKYGNAMKDEEGKPISELGKKFCKWKEIQKEIFEAVLDNHIYLLYTWEDRAKGLIDEAQQSKFPRETCDNDENKNQDDESSGAGDSTTTKGNGQTIDLRGCLPKRRNTINTRLRDIKKLIKDIQGQGDVSDDIKAKSAAAIFIGSLANQTENEIENLKKESRSNTDNVCKLYRRTFADYKDISKGTDIVKHYVSEDVQDLLKKISEKVGESKMDTLWQDYFKKTIEKKLKQLENSKKDSNKQAACTLDHSDETKPQCLRYMEEWLENFVEYKSMIERYLENRCKSNQNDNNCNIYCTQYQRFLSGRKECYNKYKNECHKNLQNHNQYRKQYVYETEIKEIEKKIKDKSGCNKCEKHGKVDLKPLFDLTDSSTNKIYYCNCNGSDKKNSPPCNQTESSKKLTLAGNWKSAAKKNSERGGGSSRQGHDVSDPCKLDYRNHGAGGGGHGADPCQGIYSGTTWDCGDTPHDGICIPPRRRAICISNIRNLKETDISNMDSNKLLLETMLAAKEQSHRLRNRGDVCDAIKSSFFDFGDIIKGTDKANDNNSKETESKLRDIFEKIREQWKKGNGGDTKYDSTASYDGLRELRKDWWKENKTTIWEAFKCGGNKCDMPQDGSSQFLRWLEEWVNEFCTERKTKEQLVNTGCKPCSGKDECTPKISLWIGDWLRPPDSICDCKSKCKDYSEWIHGKKTEFDTQKNYYDTKITSIDFGGTTSGGNHNTTTKNNISKYLNDKVKSGCSSVDFNDVPRTFSSYPDENSHYRHKCSRCYAQLEADLTHRDDKNGKETTVCGVKNILTYDKNSNLTQTCSGSGTKTNDDAVWKTKDISNKNSSSNGYKVAVPHRYDEICKGTIGDNSARENYTKDHEYYDNNRMLLSELVLVGQHESTRLQHQYSGENNNSDMCTAMKRSFADIGDIVKGTNIVDDDNGVEQYLNKMFMKLRDDYRWFGADEHIYSGDPGLILFRKNWWERNRHMVWEAFNCDDKHKCGSHMDMDRVPQLLRWVEEWSEDFTKEREKQIDKLKNACTSCTMDSDKNQSNNSQKCYPKDKCQTCKEKCNEYTKWIKEWKDQWNLFKNYYDEKEKQNKDKHKDKDNEDKDKDSTYNTLFEYMVKKLKGRGYNNINRFEENDIFANHPTTFQKICICEPTDTSTSSSGTNDQNTCNDNYKSQWNCEDKTKRTTTKMCLRTDDSSGNMDEDTFFNSFTQWLDEMSYNLNENTNTLSQTCSGKNIRGQNDAECKECQKNCTCYKTWKQKIKDQWDKQKTYFEEEKKKPGNTMNNIDINHFLYAYCWSQDKNRNENECSPKNNGTTIIDEKIEETDTRNMNMCGICPEDDPTKKKDGGDSCKDTGTNGLAGDCRGKEYDNINTNTKNYEKDWTTEAINKEKQTVNGIRVPPRRQQLCISYLAKNDINDEGKLKNMLLKTIKSETEKLYEYYKTGTPVTKNSDNNKNVVNELPTGFCKAVERSFADIGDFIKGTDLDYTVGDTKTVKDKLETYFSGKSETYRKNWWEKNKRELWKGVKCGIKDSGGATRSQCPQNLDFDGRDQFLRWFEEWGEYICIEHKNKLAHLTTECKGCTSVCPNGSGGCNKDKCTTACDKYKEWINKRKDQWKQLSSKYNEKQTHYKDDDDTTFLAKLMPPSTYLKFFNDHTCTKTYFKTLFYDKYDYGDKQELCECDQTKKKKTKPYEEDDPADDKIKEEPCNVNTTTTNISSCHEKQMEGVPWTSTYIRPDKNGKSTFGVYAPPRRQKLCVGNIWLHSTNKTNLLNELLFAAKKEGEYLKKHYDQKSGAQHSRNNYDELCTSITRSFYDLGDIVKGTDLRQGIIVTATENKIYEIFKNELSGGSGGTTPLSEDTKILEERKKWWESNKDKVWQALTCDNNCGTTTTPSDSTPQFLRWYEEWYEEFCEHRKKLLGDIKSNCGKKNSTDTCDNTDTLCSDSCSKYNNWLTPKKFEWKAQKQNYRTKKLNQHQEGNEFQNVTKGKNKLEEYLKDKSSDIKCEKDKIDNMDKIVEKKDDEYKEKYEPLCSRCRKKQLIDKANENKKKKQTAAAAAPSSSGPTSASGTPQNGGVKPSASVNTSVAPPASGQPSSSGGSPASVTPSSGVHTTGSAGRSLPPSSPASVAHSIQPSSSSSAPQTKSPDSTATSSSGTTKQACKIVEDILKTKGNDGQGRIASCGPKDTQKNWECKNTGIVSGKGECMPPRRQTLCINNLKDLYNNKATKTKEELKTALIQCASIEIYWLWDKYIKVNKDAGDNLKNNGSIPDDFKRQMFYTYGDYKDMCLGKDIGSSTDTKNIADTVTSILNNGQPSGQTKEEWWNTIKEDVWKGMLCALSYDEKTKKVEETTRKNLEKNNKYDTVNFDTTGTKLSTFSSRPQFLRWFTEWYDDYCYRKQKLYDEVKTKCKKVGDTNFKCDDTECDKSCKEYEKFMNEKKTQWDKQSKYYSDKKSGNTSDYSGTDAKEYLKNKCKSFTCGDKPSGKSQNGEEVVKNITALQQTPKYDVDQYCGCKKYINDDEYKMISNKNNCTGLQNKANGTPGIEWKYKGTRYNYRYLKELSEDVHFSSRRQNICFKDLDESKVVKDKDTLKKQLLKVAATEGYNLGQYYKDKNNNKDDTKYNYDVSPCSAMRYSFYDLRDIILGYDNLEDDKTNTERKLSGIFKKNGDSGKPGSEKRREFWTQNQKCVWNAMLCGYRKGRDDTSGGTTQSDKDLSNCDTNPPSETEYPTGNTRTDGTNHQFLRWFTEWAEDFCQKEKKELEKLQNHCSFHECKEALSQQKNECLNACGNYKSFINKWKPQYKRQNIMYEGLPDSISLITNKEAPEFIKKNCNDKCQYFENKNSATVDKVFPYPPTDYVDKCKCTNSPPPLPEKIPAIRLKRAQQLPPKPPNDDELNKCPLDDKTCKYYGDAKSCKTKTNLDELDEWNDADLSDLQTKNKGVIIPPRRRQSCFTRLMKGHQNIRHEKEFKKEILKGAITEGKLLGEYYKNNSKKAIEAMKYSFFDYGDIIKGKDMMDNNSKFIKGKLQRVLKKKSNGTTTPEEWWDQNKKHVWHAMLCGYKQTYNVSIDMETECTLPKIEEDDQFLRWLTEWATIFCYEKVDEAKRVVQNKCLQKINGAKSIDDVSDQNCKYQLGEYKNWYEKRNDQWKKLKEVYTKRFPNAGSTSSGTQQKPKEKNANEYVKNQCKECNCDVHILDDIFKESNKVNREKLLSELIKTAATDTTDRINPWEAINNFVENIKIFVPSILNQLNPNPKDLAKKLLETTARSTLNVAAQAYQSVKKIEQQIQEQKNTQSPPAPPGPPVPVPPPSSEPIPPSTPTISSPEIIVGPIVGTVAATILGILLYKVIIVVRFFMWMYP
ncbi:erythrocyte membrane protein 1 (PfEMP1), exon 1, putative [Plasmodium sp. DRC-Itaito]|nr:erythrocyte membrane protein 1 (PfEMP1), exon 1, putative [Plasmodium sp. DRC-Itaito]